MSSKPIVRTQVNEVFGGSISNVTLDVETSNRLIISATLAIGETTKGKLQKMEVRSEEEQLVKSAFSALLTELSARGIESIEIDLKNDFPERFSTLMIDRYCKKID